MKKYKILFTLFILTTLSFFTNCTPTPPDCTASGNQSVLVSWAAPHAFELTNVAGGGHRIYYSSEEGTVNTSSSFVDVPYSTSQTSGTISNLQSGCSYYVRVQAYSAKNPAGGGLSAESTVDIP